ncbi:hypothetical protein COU76_03265 [Candidatus Peregrinibacteria bacterium CG10_big_fil_rev_8_21_14_0_10_49_10]|nr:MAG: hypothetical protein COU76_03265 [Candidatus Peregrinibacteria bacterium CG10_big_fil_rev_8_21_14_0_10_49_10]
MFQSLRYTIALYFTLIVFVLLLVQGLFFIPLNYRDYLIELDDNIAQDAGRIILSMEDPASLSIDHFTERDLIRTRLFDTEGVLVYEGDIFLAQEQQLSQTPWSFRNENDRFRVLSFPVTDAQDQLVGFLQVAEVYHILWSDLWEEAVAIFIQSTLIALLTFGIGLLFSGLGLKPAMEMYTRLDAFTQDASHELKTPLASANSALDLALRSKDFVEGIQEAKSHIAMANILVNKLLMLAKITRYTLKKEECDLSALVHQVVVDCEAQAKKSSVLIVEEVTAQSQVVADRSLLQQLIANLLSNAIKFSQKGGEVRVVVQQGSLQIQDKGKGIDPQAQARVFDPFFQEDDSRSSGGHGIGLSIVKKIADAHIWHIEVQSIQGVGTSFTIVFS